MTLPAIVQAGQPVLRHRAQEIDPARIGSDEMQALVETMVAVMRDAPGVGLAAPQIGLGLRLIVLEDRPEYMARRPPEELADRERVPLPLRVIINPVLRAIVDGAPPRAATHFEGCLSVSGYMALVERHREVEVTGLDEHGQPLRWRVAGWPARILQHEVDHLDGTLYVDRMRPRSLCSNAEVSRWISARVPEVVEGLAVDAPLPQR
ncbi:MAG: peptide deformylase [Polyangiaceae bacterium]